MREVFLVCLGKEAVKLMVVNDKDNNHIYIILVGPGEHFTLRVVYRKNLILLSFFEPGWLGYRLSDLAGTW